MRAQLAPECGSAARYTSYAKSPGQTATTGPPERRTDPVPALDWPKRGFHQRSRLTRVADQLSGARSRLASPYQSHHRKVRFDQASVLPRLARAKPMTSHPEEKM